MTYLTQLYNSICMCVTKGYWRSNNLSSNILVCPIPAPCNGGDDPTTQCATGYSGTYCSVCETGYIKSPRGLCILCTDSSSSFILITLPTLFIAIVALLLVLRNRIRMWLNKLMHKFFDRFKNYNIKGISTKVKIIIGFYQITLQLQSVLGVFFPGVYQDFLSFFSFFNFDFGAIFAEVTPLI